MENARRYCQVTTADFDNAAAWEEHLNLCHPGHAHQISPNQPQVLDPAAAERYPPGREQREEAAAAVTVHLREREVLVRIVTPESEGDRCTYCKKPAVKGEFYWLGEDGQPARSDPHWGDGSIMTFRDWRHADGSPGHGKDGNLVLRDTNRCPECKAFGTITARDTGYGSDCTCTCTACGWNQYFDRGD
jgi:hypothetical protein